MSVRSRIIVQSDWNESLINDGDTAWVTFKLNSGVPGIHGQLTSNGVSSNGVPYVFPSDGFTVNNISQRSLTVSYNDKLCRYVAPLVTYATVHDPNKSVSSLDVTSGGLAVSADVTGKCHIWTVENGEIRRSLEGHCGDVYTCRFFPSGVVVLTGGADSQLKVWSAETGQCAATLRGHTAGVTSTTIVERGRCVISASRDGTARLWDVGTQVCLTSYAPEGGLVNGCALSGVTKRVNLELPDEPVAEREVGTQGKLLLLATESGQLAGYGLHSKKKVFEYSCLDAINCCCFLNDTTVVCGTQNSELHIIDLRNPSQPLRRFQESRAAILSLLPYQQGFFASSGDGSCFFSDELMEASLELTGPDCDPVYQVATDDRFIYTCCRDSFIRKYAVDASKR